jgi:hypothetical protein
VQATPGVRAACIAHLGAGQLPRRVEVRKQICRATALDGQFGLHSPDLSEGLGDTGCAGAFCRSELAGIKAPDLDFAGHGLGATLCRGKTDQERKNPVSGISFGSDLKSCPMRVVRALRPTRGVWHRRQGCPSARLPATPRRARSAPGPSIARAVRSDQARRRAWIWPGARGTSSAPRPGIGAGRRPLPVELHYLYPCRATGTPLAGLQAGQLLAWLNGYRCPRGHQVNMPGQRP